MRGEAHLEREAFQRARCWMERSPRDRLLQALVLGLCMGGRVLDQSLRTETDRKRKDRTDSVWLERFQSPHRQGLGAMGKVWRALDLRLNRFVAIKGMRRSLEEPQNRLLREAQLQARMQHPSLVQVFDLLYGPSPETPESDDGEKWWLVMELVEGETLMEKVRRQGPLPVLDAVILAKSVAGGLAVMHAYGMMHRDLSGGNVILSSKGPAKIADFGTAKGVEQTVSGSGSTADFDTDTGIVLGTPGFIAPERLEGETGRIETDLYGLGAVLYLALTGLRVHEDPGQDETRSKILLRRVLERPAPDPRKYRRECPSALARCVMRLLARNPSDRIPSAEEVETMLGDIELLVRLRSRKSSRGEMNAFQRLRPWIRTLIVWGTGVAVGALGAMTAL